MLQRKAILTALHKNQTLPMNTQLSRRDFLKASVLAAASPSALIRLASATTVRQPGRTIARGPFQPTWESLARHYRVPEWFRGELFTYRRRS
jgi:hypothetical protein